MTAAHNQPRAKETRQQRSINPEAQAIEFDDYEEATSQGVHPALDIVGGRLYVTVRVSVKGELRNVVLASNELGNIEMYPVDEWKHVSSTLKVPLLREADISDLPPRWDSDALREIQQRTLSAPTWREAYDAIYKAFDEHLVVADRRYLVVLTLHAMMTYFHPMFDNLPILHFYGQSDSGKSRAATALGNVAFNAKVSASATASSIFRSADKGRFTRILTEMDNLAELNSGNAFVQQMQGSTTKSEAYVEVSDKPTNGVFKPTLYYGFSPRVLGSTKTFRAPTLRNRCIRLTFHKVANVDMGKLSRGMNENADWIPLRDKMYRLQLLDWHEAVKAHEYLKREWIGKGVPTGRVRDKWLPLATMALQVGGDVLEVVAQLAMESMDEQKEENANSQPGILCNFMEYVVRDGDAGLQRKELWERFLHCANRPTVEQIMDSDVPDWAKACGDSITCGKLREMFRNDRNLAQSLKDLGLIPKDTSPSNGRDLFRIKQATVREITQATINVPDRKEQATSNQPTPFQTTSWDDAEENLPF